jgi:hypothetical protein
MSCHSCKYMHLRSNKILFRKIVEKVLLSVWQGEGRGARVRRSIGRRELTNLDPFLMLDEFAGNANDGAGFPGKSIFLNANRPRTRA